MKTKILSAFLFTLVFSLAMVNAANLISITNGPVLTQSNLNTYFDIFGVANSTVNMPASVLRVDDGNNNFMTLTLNPVSLNQALTQGATQRVTASLVIDPNFNFQIKTYTFPIINITAAATASNGTALSDSKTVSLTFKKTFCKFGENGTALSISQVDINNEDGDDTEWKPLDHIKINVRVENNGNDKIKEINVELGLINSDGKNIVKDLEKLDNKKIDLGSINDGDDKSTAFEFDVPADFEEENYDLVVKAYSDDKGEKNLCTSSSSDLSDNFFQSIDGVRETTEEKQIVLTNIVASPEIVQCGEKLHISAEVFNIGDESYEDQVKVNVYNKELGINQDQIIREDFDQGDSSSVDFDLDIPSTAKEKSYTLEFKTYYDYRSSSDSYNIQSEDRFIQAVSVQGNCNQVSAAPTLRISAELSPETPEAVPGEELIVNAVIKNLGTTSATWNLATVGNSAWSSLVSIEPQTLILAAGESKDVTIKLSIDSQATGDQEFIIRATSGDKTVEQKIALTISQAPKSSGAFIAHIKANWFIYLIILVNIILIIAIISVIRRMIGGGSSTKEYQ